MCIQSHQRCIQILSFCLLLITYIPAQASNPESDKEALQGVKEIKAIYDIRVSQPKKFAFFLEVIGKTYNGIIDQRVNPQFVVAVRGPAIRFISSETWSFSEEDQKYLETSAKLIGDLKRRGVRFEACSIAAGLFNIDHDTYLEGVNPVSNTFISLTGYQSQGYGLVPIN